ncbi:recombination regulator RecX [Rossellomorea aquimaris]|uniref:recombination regulator RecX n=1 Tax=Rossellomorea aquimaris TaxID=189382 RepID=UPI001CD683FC|nr:recombination regulator RecX [Rossellomorea aquimaris]MCA1055620.1 recombination regulator RecX [Rossellomorea aquimaris]
MGVITKITKQVKNDERYNLFIDGTYAFSVDEGVLAKFGLRKGLEVDELAISEMQYEDDVKKALNKAIHFLSFRMRTEDEVRDHLKRSEWEEGIVGEVIHKLKDMKYLNDLEFAQAFTGTQINTSDKGPIWIRGELQRKGVDERYIEEALQAFTFEEQVDKAVSISEKLMRKYRKDSVVIAKQKIEQNLQRKGYPNAVMKVVWETTDAERDADEQWDAIYHQGQKAHRRLAAKFEGFEYEQKMKQALYRKGFSMDKIERLLEVLKEEGGG